MYAFDCCCVLQEFGDVRNIHIGVEKRSGYVAGYGVIEYATESEAANAIKQMNGATLLLGEELKVDWAFVHGTTATAANKRAAAGGGGGRGSQRRRR
jgi:RNA-binding protein 8A